MSDAPGETLQTRLERRPLLLSEVLDLAAQIAAELAAAHGRGVVHGALTVSQIRICPVERVQVVGWGGGHGDPQNDVRALGGILREMLAGRAVPPAVSRLVERALAEDPVACYGRIEEMLADLQAAEMEIEEQEEQEEQAQQRTDVPVLPTGSRISHFQIAELLGGGGMGVVYRAEDTRLGRTVALKFLAPEHVRDPVAKARFLTEARTASALEHPNLCTIFDVGESAEGLLFLAMPLYEGESLDRRLARGALPLQEALDVATQAARGLAEAHRLGVVHRDVKPANLFLTGSGLVKVLDFGIAKLADTTGLTGEGSLLGTPVYMAPEQMRGEEVDARADVWSLGVVLYQMLAGRPPFAAGTGAAVVHAVLYEEPEALSRRCPAVPEAIERIVSRMLERDPERRYADAGEALVDLLRAQAAVSAAWAASTAAAALPPPPTGRRRWRAGLVALGLALVAAALAAIGLLAWRRAAGPQPTSFTRLTDFQGRETFPSLSPDGTFFAYARSVGGNSDVFLQRVGGGNPINLTNNSRANDTQPAFSPDGQQIAFRSEREGGGIFLMGTTGESVRRLTDFGFNPAWSPDGRELVMATEAALDPTTRYSLSQIFRVDAATGRSRRLAVRDGVQPSWSPHGWRIAFWGLTEPGARRAIWTVPAAGGPPVSVVDDAYYNWSPVWSPDGRFLYFASNRGGSMNLWRVAVDEKTGAVLGSPQPITTPSEWSALPSFSRDGRLLLYATNDSRSFVDQVPFDPESGRPAGRPALVFQGERGIATCELSPDGSWLALWSAAPQEDLLLVRPDGSDLRQLTNDPAHDRGPRWSPDGRRILFFSNRSGKYEAWTIRPDGSGLTQVTRLGSPVFDPFWSPDSRHIGFTYGNLGTGILDLSGRAPRLRLLSADPSGLVPAAVSWSPDGRLLAGLLMRPDGLPVPGIVVWSLADHTSRRLTASGFDPQFFHGGTRILFTEPAAVRLVDVASGEVRTLLSPDLPTSYVSARLGPHDRTLCTVRTTTEGDIWRLTLVAPHGLL